MLRFGSVCSGVEAASLAWEPLGMRPAWFAEVEPFCCALLSHRWPTVPNLGDITHDDFTRRAAEAAGPEGIDVLVGGTPCQGFSTAGKRGGFNDPRSRLVLSFSNIAEALKPTWVVWENVPGSLSSGGGRDLGAFLGTLADIGYDLCWRVLDARHFGVPQRRRRIFVVGRLGAGRPDAVLFEQEGEGRHPSPRRQAKPRAAGGHAAGPGKLTPPATAATAVAAVYRNSGRGYWSDDGIAATVGTQGRGIHESNIAVAAAFEPTTHHPGDSNVGPMGTLRTGNGGLAGGAPFVAVCALGEHSHTLVSKSYSAGEDGTGRGTPVVAIMDSRDGNNGDPSPKLKADGSGGVTPTHDPVVLAFDSKKDALDADTVSPTLRAMNFDKSHMNGGGQVGVVYMASMTDADDPPGAAHAHAHAHAHAAASETECLGLIDIKNGLAPHGSPALEEISTSLLATDHKDMKAVILREHTPPVAFDLRGREGGAMPEGPHPTCNIRSASGGSARSYLIDGKLICRRLTPLECERLQGFPSGHTLVPYKGKPASDSSRYKAIGNSFAVPVVAWIGKRLLLVHQGIDPDAVASTEDVGDGAAAPGV